LLLPYLTVERFALGPHYWTKESPTVVMLQCKQTVRPKGLYAYSLLRR